jgi:anti-sigma-K factor RskA
MDCHEIEELSGAYALDALSPEERKAVDEHLAECPKCAQEIRQLQAVVDLFPLSVPGVEPPPRMKERIFAKIHDNNTPQTQRTVTPRSVRKARDTVWTPVFAAIAAVLLISFGLMLGWNLSLQQQLQKAATTQSTPHVTPSATPNSTISFTMKGTQASSGITGETIYLPQQNMTLLVLHNLPKLSGKHVYQGWLIVGKQVTNAGLLNVQNNTATLDFPGDARDYETAAVSLEPGPQASLSAPQGPVLATGTLK